VSLATGARLGSYEVVGPIGKGGMGDRMQRSIPDVPPDGTVG
jgi:hypothetical protein